MISTSDHEIRQSSPLNTVESHLMSSTTLDLDSTTRTDSIIVVPTTSIPASPRSIHFQEISNVESQLPPYTTRDPDPVKGQASTATFSPTSTPTSPRSIHFQETVESNSELTRPMKRQASMSHPLPTPTPTSPRSLHFHETATEVRFDTHPGAQTEIYNWQGPDRAKLVKDGYQNLAIMCTFVAGVQAQLLQMTYTQSDKRSQIATALFFSGLFADISAAILSASSARWFEMLTPEEANHIYDWLTVPKGSPPVVELEAHISTTDDKSHFVVEKWLLLGLKSGLYTALLGLGLLVSGVMLYVWAHMPMVVQVMSTVSCAYLVLLLPPFFLPHNRVKTLEYVRFHRFSGRDIGHIRSGFGLQKPYNGLKDF